MMAEKVQGMEREWVVTLISLGPDAAEEEITRWCREKWIPALLEEPGCLRVELVKVRGNNFVFGPEDRISPQYLMIEGWESAAKHEESMSKWRRPEPHKPRDVWWRVQDIMPEPRRACFYYGTVGQ